MPKPAELGDPKGEADSLHLTVLLNLEGMITMWGNGHMFLSIGKHSFYLYDYHQKVMKFIKWVFEQKPVSKLVNSQI